jgi:hypothetical protein
MGLISGVKNVIPKIQPKDVHMTIEDIMTKEGKERKDALVTVSFGSLLKIFQTSPSPKTRKRKGEEKANSRNHRDMG